MRLEYCLRAGATCALTSVCPLAACRALTRTLNGCFLIPCVTFTVTALQADQQLDERMSTRRLGRLQRFARLEDTEYRQVYLSSCDASRRGQRHRFGHGKALGNFGSALECRERVLLLGSASEMLAACLSSRPLFGTFGGRKGETHSLSWAIAQNVRLSGSADAFSCGSTQGALQLHLCTWSLRLP